MLPLSLARPLAALAGVAALAVGFQLWVKSIENRGAARCELAHQQAALEAAQEAQRLTRMAQDRNAEVTRGLQQQLAREKDRAASNDTLVNRLRIAIDEANGSAGGADDTAARLDAYAERAGVLGEILAESAGLLEEGRGKVAGLAAKTTALQAYFSQVCVVGQK